MTRIVRGLVVPMAALVFLLSGPSGATGATITLSDVTDGFAISSDNFQTASPPQIRVPFLEVTKFGTSEARAALEFDLSSLPASAVVTSASLELSFFVADTLIGVNGATGDGLITPADFTFGGQVATFDPSFGVNTVNVTSFIAGMVGTHFVVFQLRELAEDTNLVGGGAELSASAQPRLVITTTATPAPAALLLVGVGLATLHALSWWRRD